MPMLQIRHVPEDLHRLLKSRAALAGQSLSEYALEQVRRSLERPTRDELFSRLAARPVRDVTSPTAIVRSDRENPDPRHVGG